MFKRLFSTFKAKEQGKAPYWAKRSKQVEEIKKSDLIFKTTGHIADAPSGSSSSPNFPACEPSQKNQVVDRNG